MLAKLGELAPEQQQAFQTFNDTVMQAGGVNIIQSYGDLRIFKNYRMRHVPPTDSVRGFLLMSQEKGVVEPLLFPL